MKHERESSFGTNAYVERMGAEMAIQFMLMTLFQILSQMVEDPHGFRVDVHSQLVDLAATYKLPPMPKDEEAKVRTAAKIVIDGLTLKWVEQTPREHMS
jgi:hypothetical protein